MRSLPGIIFLWLTLLAHISFAQVTQPEDFTVELEEVSFSSLPGFQSYAWGASGGKILIAGGRINGLHGFNPNNSFPPDSANKQLWVIDPSAQQVWSWAVDQLTVTMADQLKSTNMQFYQKGEILYLTGGYGYVQTINNYRTFPYLMAIRIDSAIAKIMNGSSPAAYIRQVFYDDFAVTGGHLDMIDSTFYLVGGHRFDGRYNPHGNPSYTQEYTCAIRKFNVLDDGTSLSIANFSEIYDNQNLHRRDYNMSQQIFPDGSFGFTVFSGVFRHNADLPFFDMVDIHPGSYQVVDNYSQFLNQYHTANLSVYDSAANAMHTLFFGGIGMYTYDAASQLLIVDSAVPFVKTISMMTRFSDSSMTETCLPQEMPGYLGASAEFIPLVSVPYYRGDIIHLNALDTVATHVGYILGGIESSQPNIFMQMNGWSLAAKRLFKVKIKKETSAGIASHLTGEIPVFDAFPSPFSDVVTLSISNMKCPSVMLSIFDPGSRLVLKKELKTQGQEAHLYHLDLSSLEDGFYIAVLECNSSVISRKLIKSN